jgi:hypothetical protein
MKAIVVTEGNFEYTPQSGANLVIRGNTVEGAWRSIEESMAINGAHDDVTIRDNRLKRP